MQTRSAKEFGAALRQARLLRGITQRDLADAVGVTQSAISKVEKGNPGTSLGLVFQILRVLQLPVSMVSPSSPPLRDVDDEDFVDLDAIADTGLKRK